MDFLKKAAENVGGNGDSKAEGSGKTEDASKKEGKYDQYVDKGVDYAEERFMGTDVKNKSESVQKRDDQISGFISSNIDKYAGGSK